MEWSQLSGQFERDGFLRDIYVLGTELADWERVLEHLERTRQPLTFQRNGAPAPLPIRAAEVLADHEAVRLLAFQISGVLLHCHFFWDREIEFDLDPVEVRGLPQLEALAEFMTELGRLTQKVVILTPENSPEAPILRFDPAHGTVVYVPPPAQAAV